MSTLAAPSGVAAPRRIALFGEALAARGGLVLVACGLFVFLTAPLAAIFLKEPLGIQVVEKLLALGSG